MAANCLGLLTRPNSRNAGVAWRGIVCGLAAAKVEAGRPWHRRSLPGVSGSLTQRGYHAVGDGGSQADHRNGPFRTPLFQLHLAHEAKMVDYAGWKMPLWYDRDTQTESHNFTRTHASLFDVSHMAQHRFRGKWAAKCLEGMCPSDIANLELMRSQLTTLLLPKTGGIVDDAMVTRLGEDDFLVVTNAARFQPVTKYFQGHMDRFNADRGLYGTQYERTPVWRISQRNGMLALQGPRSAEILHDLLVDENYDLSKLYFGNAAWLALRLSDGTSSRPLLISRTGYTGEDGFEIAIGHEEIKDHLGHRSPANPFGVDPLGNVETQQVAEAILEVGGQRVRLAGLAVRDSLRIEAGLCLYGQEMDEGTTPVEANLSWLISPSRREKADFPGAEVIIKQLNERALERDMGDRRPNRGRDPEEFNIRTGNYRPPLPMRLAGKWRVGLILMHNGPAARTGSLVLAGKDLHEKAVEFADDEDAVVGRVTSATRSPTLGGVKIAIAYVNENYHSVGSLVRVRVATSGVGSILPARVCSMPFVPHQFWRKGRDRPIQKRKPLHPTMTSFINQARNSIRVPAWDLP